MITDTQRHASKIRKFQAAVERVGFDKVEAKIGKGAASAFVCAADAQYRKQSPDIVGPMLSSAQERAYKHLELAFDEDVYDILWSLK